jgi:hypothetical protein
MARDFESFIVDPSLLDPSIDATDLRTTTDTRQELLSDVPDYQGIQFDPTQRSYVSDLYALYSGQLPMMPEVTASAPPSSPPSGGGDGGGSQPGNEGPPSTVISPQFPDYADPGVDAEENQPYFDATDTSGVTGDPIEIENISSNPYDIPMDVDDPGASIENIIAQNPSGTIGGASEVFDINETGDPSQNPGSTNVGDQFVDIGVEGEDPDRFSSISTIANPDIFDSYAGVDDPQVGDLGFTNYTPSFESKKESTIQNILGKAGQTVEGALTELGKIPGAIVDATNKTVDVFGKKLNVGKTLTGFALNKVFGAPVSLLFGLKGVVDSFKKDDNKTSTTPPPGLDEDIGVEGEDEDRFTDTTSDQIDEFDTTPQEPDDIEDFLNTSDLDFENQYEDEDRFTGDTTDTTVTGVTRPGTGTVLGKEGIERFDDAETDVDLDSDDYSGKSSTDIFRDFVGSLYNEKEIDRLQGKYFQDSLKRSGDYTGATGIASDARHEAAMNELSKTLSPGIVPDFIGDAGALLGGTLKEIGALGRGLDKKNLDAIIEDMKANYKGTFGTPNTKTAEQVFEDVYSRYRDPIMDMVEDKKTLADEDITNIDDYITNEDLFGGFDEKEEAKKQQQLEETAKKQRELQQKIKDAENKEAERVAAAEKAAADKAKAQRIAQEKIREAERQERERVATAEKAAAAKAKAQREMKEKIARAEKEEADRQAAAQKAAEAKAKAEREAQQKIRDAENREAERQAAERQRAAEKAAKDKRDMQQRIRDAENNRQEQEARDRATREKDLGSGPPGIGGGGGGGGGGGCFLADTLITMADGSTKEVQKVDLGDNVAEGGKVFATGKFLVENLHDYKGIKVSGSHMVNEDDNWVRVKDSKHGKPLGDDEHTVYVFGSENRRILINGILFTDYFETTEQEKLINDEKDFFNNWKTYENKIDQDNINILNAS